MSHDSPRPAGSEMPQSQISSGYVEDFFPYRRKLRFARENETRQRVYNG